MVLKSIEDVDAFMRAVDKCDGDVILRSPEGEEVNVKSGNTKYIAIGRLCEDQGDAYELFCMNKCDEPHFFEFYREIKYEAALQSA